MNKLTLLACCTAVSLSAYSNIGLAEVTKKSVRGAWEVEVTLRFDAPDCTSAAIVPGGVNPFPTLYTFHKGGTLSEYGSRNPPSHRTPGHGVWKEGNESTFITRYTFLTFDVNGIQDARLDVTSELSLTGDGQAVTGTGRYVRTDISGNSTPFCATITGERITF